MNGIEIMRQSVKVHGATKQRIADKTAPNDIKGSDKE